MVDRTGAAQEGSIPPGELRLEEVARLKTTLATGRNGCASSVAPAA